MYFKHTTNPKGGRSFVTTKTFLQILTLYSYFHLKEAPHLLTLLPLSRSALPHLLHSLKVFNTPSLMCSRFSVMHTFTVYMSQYGFALF